MLDLFLIKMQARDFNFTKKRLQHRRFPMKFAKLFRTPILKNICKRLPSSIFRIFTFLLQHFCFPMLSSSKITRLCFFIHFQWIDVKSNRCFRGLSLISIILWEYCENNIKTFWYYSYENKQSVPTNKIIFILIRIYVRIS